MTRRTLLHGLLLLVGSDPVELVVRLSGRAREAGSRLLRRVLEPPPASPPLSTSELDDLIAFAGILVEGRALTPAERQYVLEHIENRTRRSPRYLPIYRATVSLLERLAGRRFSSLDPRERVELVVRHRLGASDVRPDEDLGRFPEEMRTLRTRAVRDLVGGYYNSPAGWAVVGYQTFPGRCGDLARYTHPES